MADLLSLCTELVIQPESGKPDNPVLTDCLKGLQSHRVLKYANDESLGSVVKLMNQLLNEPKTRAKGLMLFDSFLAQVDSTRYVAIQDSFVSAIQLLSKCLDLDLSHRVLVNLLTVCNKAPEFNQAVTASIVPKLLSRFSDTSASKSLEEIQSLVVCLERYRGPCGSHRAQLEKFFLNHIVDSRRDDLVQSVAKVFPLLSATGGGGTKGDKYSQDWQQSVIYVLKIMYDTLYSLYGDASNFMDPDNPYVNNSSDGMELPSIRHADILLRMSSICRRLCNLSCVLTAYLTEPFPAPKLVPVRGILRIISNMMLLNPLSLLKNSDSATPKELAYLAGLVPSVLGAAFQLLNSLMLCCGSQIFPEVSGIEHLIVEQSKWLLEKPASFESLRVEIYRTLYGLLKLTHGCVTSTKNASSFVQLICQEIRISKQSISLAKMSKGRKAMRSQGITSIQNSSEPEIIEKSEVVCLNALKTLQLLIPALDSKDIKSLYQLLTTTIWDLLKTGDPPSPYKEPEVRSSVFNCLAQLILTPNPKSPVSVGVITNLLQLGAKDPNYLVSSTCEQLLSMVERVINPPAPTLQFPPINIAHQTPTELPLGNGYSDALPENGVDSSDNEDFAHAIPLRLFRTETGCQTDDIENDGELSRSTLDVSFIKNTVSQAFRENLEELGSILNLSNQEQQSRRSLLSVNRSSMDEDDSNDNLSQSSENFLHETDDVLDEEEDEYTAKMNKRPRLTTNGGHIVLAEEVDKDLSSFDKAHPESDYQATSKFSSSHDLNEENVSVSVDDMLLTFDEETRVSSD